jgi:hypothetical protein
MPSAQCGTCWWHPPLQGIVLRMLRSGGIGRKMCAGTTCVACSVVEHVLQSMSALQPDWETCYLDLRPYMNRAPFTIRKDSSAARAHQVGGQPGFYVCVSTCPHVACRISQSSNDPLHGGHRKDFPSHAVQFAELGPSCLCDDRLAFSGNMHCS